jgi:hypothetical protein
MELYAQGLSLAPESGRGSGYFQNDHREYYSQFPAHNTVVADGKSTYASMKSNHPMSLQAVSPQPGSAAAAALPLATFADVAFREPETDADQQRVLGTVLPTETRPATTTGGTASRWHQASRSRPDSTSSCPTVRCR